MTKEVGQFEVTERGIERVIALHDFGGYSIELVIPKNIFVEAYLKYIEPYRKANLPIPCKKEG